MRLADFVILAMVLACNPEGGTDETDTGDDAEQGSEGWCDLEGDTINDRDCLLDGVCEAVDRYGAGDMSAAELRACWESGTGGSDACGGDGFVLDPNDPDCEECDFFPEEERCGG